MRRKLSSSLFPSLTFLSLLLFLFCYHLLPLATVRNLPPLLEKPLSSRPPCDLFRGNWVLDPQKPQPFYNDSCPFHRHAWNCLRNKRDNMETINSWKWVPRDCALNRIDPWLFMGMMRNTNIGFVGDSLNENFLVSFLCILRVADMGAKKWKKKGAWRGAYFPKYNVTVAYHRAVLLAKYQWQPQQSTASAQEGSKGSYRVDVDIPADEWIRVSDFYDVLVFNTGHWWGYDKFPKETPLIFYEAGKPITPPLEMFDGLKVVVQNMIRYIEKEVPRSTIKFWRLQSPRHFYGGEWNQNGSCLFKEPLDESEVDLWFDPSKNGANKEARRVNLLIKEALEGKDVELIDVGHLSEFRADGHPAMWLGKSGAVADWGQDCLHWCLPGVPDTWVDILAHLILHHRRRRRLELDSGGG